MTLRRDRILSPNYSSRGNSTVTTIVLHTAEGARTYQSLGQFFQNPRAGVSSHVGIDDTPGVVGEYVYRQHKAWTASAANPWSVQAELCAFARWNDADWNAHFTMLDNTAAWIAEEAAHYGIPLVALDAAGAQNPSVRGVCQHADLGRMGGSHWDCGPGFPMTRVLAIARGQKPEPAPTPTPTTGDDDMPYLLVAPQSGGRWWITDLRTNSRPCDSLDDAINTDYLLRELGKVAPLVCNRDASGAVAGPIAIDDAYLAEVTAYAAGGDA